MLSWEKHSSQRHGICVDIMQGEQRFDFIFDSKTFFSIPYWLDLEGRWLPVIGTGRKPAHWHCWEIGPLSENCSGNKVDVKAPDHIRNSLRPTMAKGKKEPPVVSRTVGTTVPVEGKKVYPARWDFPFTIKGVGQNEEVERKVADSRKGWEEAPIFWSSVRESYSDRTNSL